MGGPEHQVLRPARRGPVGVGGRNQEGLQEARRSVPSRSRGRGGARRGGQEVRRDLQRVRRPERWGAVQLPGRWRPALWRRRSRKGAHTRTLLQTRRSGRPTTRTGSRGPKAELGASRLGASTLGASASSSKAAASRGAASGSSSSSSSSSRKGRRPTCTRMGAEVRAGAEGGRGKGGAWSLCTTCCL